MSSYYTVSFQAESLGELLAKCVEITAPGSQKDSDAGRKHEVAWIVRWAVRAVAGEIIRTGKIPLPLKVRFVGAAEDIPNWRLEYDGEYGLN
jgi:hypothetical protein